jgi:hypothetical protein
MKLHGSLSWQIVDEEGKFSVDLKNIRELKSKTIQPEQLVEITPETTMEQMLDAASKKAAPEGSLDAFMKAYEELLIVVNPTKDKFRHTLLNETYYELLRLYSNELEKENTLLFVMGFSFADEHIREITVRAANSNPTLMIKVIAYSSDAHEQIRRNFQHHVLTNNNLEIVAPEVGDDGHGGKGDTFKFDFKTLNERIFDTLLRNVECE